MISAGVALFREELLEALAGAGRTSQRLPPERTLLLRALAARQEHDDPLLLAEVEIRRGLVRADRDTRKVCALGEAYAIAYRFAPPSRTRRPPVLEPSRASG